ncbi:MAG: tRNA lysidine(34) synthetase TilS [Acidimicrobiia bacterium]
MIDHVVEAVASAVGDGNCLVALGGGADSAVLLWAATEAVGADRVQGVFVFHGLEGSMMLQDAAIAVADKVGVTCEIVERIVAEGGNLEARARTARYGAIEGVMVGGVIALTGHTADDQAETVLMRLLRGSGAGAIAGIPYRRGVWRRPLLEFSRAELRSRASDLGLPFADDPANEDQRFLRSRIRHGVMPVIETHLGPDVKSALRRSAALLAQDDALLDAEADRIPVAPTTGGVAIPIGALIAAPDPVASRAIRRAIRGLRDGSPGTMSDVDAVASVARGGGSVSISGALQVTREPPFVTLHAPANLEPSDGFAVTIGDTFAWSGSQYSVSRADVPPPVIAGGRFTVLNADAVMGRMFVRGLQAGDRVDIEVGSTPAKELLRAAGVPPRVRPNSLVVTVDARIAALAGVRVASWAKPGRDRAAVIIEREVGT